MSTTHADPLGRSAVEELTLLLHDAPAALAIERRIVQVAADAVDELLRRLGHAHRAVPRDVHVVREPVGSAAPSASTRTARRRRTTMLTTGVSKIAASTAIVDATLHDDVAVAHRVGQMLLALGRDVHRHAVAGV